MATEDAKTVPENASKLKCGICHTLFLRPKLLPCYHTFCQACLQTLAGSCSAFPCPACRVLVAVPAGGVKSLQTNYHIDALVRNQLPDVILCDACATHGAVFKCLQCKQTLCRPCQNVHSSYSVCRSHTVLPLAEDGDAPASLSEKKQCSMHPGHLQILHCIPCQINVCMLCRLTSHIDHFVDPLVDPAAKVRAKLQTAEETLGTQKKAMEMVLVTAVTECSRLDQQRRRLEGEAIARGEALIQCCRDAVQEFIDDLHVTADSILAPFRTRIAHVRGQHAELTEQLDHVTEVLVGGGDDDVMRLEAQLGDAFVDFREVYQLYIDMKGGVPALPCAYNPNIIDRSHLRDFIGTATVCMETPTLTGADTYRN